MQDYVHLHVHTQYSLLDGQSKIPNIVNKAVANGMRGMAITDHGNMMGVKELADYIAKIKGDAKKDLAKLEEELKEADEKRKKEIEDNIEYQHRILAFKPIFGCEMYVAHNKKEDKIKENGDASGYHLIVLAKNYNGYKNLIKLVSRAWVDGLYYKPRTDRADLEKFHEDLIVSSACIAGEVPAKILKGDMDGAREAIEWYKRVFGDDYYLELQRHEVKDPDILANRETFPLQQKANAELIKLAKEYGIKLICTNDCHFENKETAEAHDHLLCLATGKDLNDPTRMRYSKQEWFKTREEMNEVFADIPEALSNTCEVCDKVSEYSIDHGPIMPFFPIPEEFGTEEQWRAKISEEELYKEFTSDENGENPLPKKDADAVIERLGGFDKIYRIKFEADYLAKLAYDGAKKRYGDPVPPNVAEHIKFELHVMKTMGFPGYFLIVQDFINAARKELGVIVGPGRGSAAGSVVAYCLGITKIDPLKYDLLFERFLNPDRVNLPDIDTDFDDDGRGKVLRWVMDKYGHENCAHIITYGTMATKNSIKDVARVEGLPLPEANALCKAIPDKLPDGLKMNLKNAIQCTRELQLAEASSDEKKSGAQFGGKAFAHDIRVIRLPRHGASCPIGLGVSCSADRNIKAKINKDGIWLEKMDSNPASLIPEHLQQPGDNGGIAINLDKGIDAALKELTKYPVSTRVSLSGTIIVARDIAHAKLKARLDSGEGLPQYFKDYPVLYAGPAKTPEGYPCGSMGPTTSNRMDPYVDEFQANGASMIMIGKGNRGKEVTDACKKHGGFYLGTIGGVAAVLSQDSIKSIECVEFPEIGMEAVWKITVENFPAFILVDDKGNDFFTQLKPWCAKCSK